jgi:hypothetical protein
MTDYQYYFLDISYTGPASTCLEACEDGDYANDSNLCKACYNECLTCSSYATCLSCDPDGLVPYLFNSYCYTECPEGSYNNDNVCDAC